MRFLIADHPNLLQQRMLSVKGKISGSEFSVAGRTGNQLADIPTGDSLCFPRAGFSSLGDQRLRMSLPTNILGLYSRKLMVMAGNRHMHGWALGGV